MVTRTVVELGSSVEEVMRTCSLAEEAAPQILFAVEAKLLSRHAAVGAKLPILYEAAGVQQSSRAVGATAQFEAHHTPWPRCFQKGIAMVREGASRRRASWQALGEAGVGRMRWTFSAGRLMQVSCFERAVEAPRQALGQ